MIPKSDWQWFGQAGHHICSDRCRFHLHTHVGDVCVSTVGEFYVNHRDDEPETVGSDRLYETMVFRARRWRLGLVQPARDETVQRPRRGERRTPRRVRGLRDERRHMTCGALTVLRVPGNGLVTVRGYGIGWKDTKRHRLYYSERGGAVPTVRVGAWSLSLIRPRKAASNGPR